MNKYDIIIIGSGLGGLECGAILSKEGYNVCVLEKNILFGGCLQSYKRKGELLDTGIHYVGSLDEGQMLNQCFRYFGIMDKLKLQRLDEDCFDEIHCNGKTYNYAMGIENFTESMINAFPKEKENLKRYVKKIEEVGNLISIEHLKKGLIAADGMEYINLSASKFIDEITPNEDLRKVLAANCMLYGGLRETSSLYQHAMINNSYIESSYRFMDGSMQIATELINTIRENGGTVLNNSEVSRIVVENDVATGVEINGKEKIEAKYIISNIHPKCTLDLTDKNKLIKKAYITRINSLKNSYGVFTLQLLMKKQACRYINRNYYLHANNDVWYNKPDGSGKIKNCMISMQPSSEELPYAGVVTMLIPMQIDELSPWLDTKPNKRGEDYLQFKEKKKKAILQFVAEQGFDYSDAINSAHSTSPLSFRDYTGTVDGSAYGIIKDCKQSYVSFISPRTKIKNLFLTGQNLNVHGALGVSLTALATSAIFLGEEYLAKKIGNA